MAYNGIKYFTASRLDISSYISLDTGEKKLVNNWVEKKVLLCPAQPELEQLLDFTLRGHQVLPPLTELSPCNPSIHM